METTNEPIDEKIINEIVGKLDTVKSTDPDSRAYENEVAKIANTYHAGDLIHACEPILADKTQSIEMRYKCFYALSVQYRTLLDYKRFDDILHDYGAEFVCFASLSHLQLMQGLEQIKNGFFDGTFLELSELLDRGLDNCVTLSRNVGAMHAYCDLEASIYEYLLLQDKSEDLKKLDLYFEKAMTYVIKCIRMEQYPKFYSTQARLYIQAKEYTKAYQSISTAIAKEPVPKSGEDTGKYNMKILNYNMIKNSISNTKNTTYIEAKAEDLKKDTQTFKTEVDNFNKKLDDANDEFSAKLEESSTKSIEIIGFFSGIISFFISSIQIATNMTVHDAGALIALLMGSCIMAYTAFSVLLHNFETQYIKKCMVMALIGLFIMLGGSFFGLFL